MYTYIRIFIFLDNDHSNILYNVGKKKEHKFYCEQSVIVYLLYTVSLSVVNGIANYKVPWEVRLGILRTLAIIIGRSKWHINIFIPSYYTTTVILARGTFRFTIQI